MALHSPTTRPTRPTWASIAIRNTDVVALFLRHLRQCAQFDAGATIERVVLARPTFFVDGGSP
ncbi:hypothetical protein KZJ38_27340 [Paraburkholderia edwinii]|uniref:Uncharacterized protein n=1 Tax=Paraburkholderia edwinii TaxID=2861782 RepID=A0ABX8UWI1_9BURK|nr:hypothetical protein [Paraburkholderia edwinii]QYD73349.1 hypothetical protein KZJ38_27340 [Paraburkholderia edwinii]